MSTVLAFSIIFHVLYGAIMGSITAVLVDHLPVPRRTSPPKEESKDKKTDFSEAA
jgi:hypothetical protein